MYGPCKDEYTVEWRIHKKKELQELYQRPRVKEDIPKEGWSEHAILGKRQDHW